MTKAAYLVGIDNYPFSPLKGCENDALALSEMLQTNFDGSPNVQCRTFLSSRETIGRGRLRGLASEIFSMKGLDLALFYFAGHGSRGADGAFLVSQDANENDEGMMMSELVNKANGSDARERIIILDCCHAGAVDQLFEGHLNISLKSGVSILAACRDVETAAEVSYRGLFSKTICDALDGGAADVIGGVTVASVYAYLDEVLTLWEQRPILKANVEKLISLRDAEPSVSRDKLRKMVTYFPTDNFSFPLDPSFEPTEQLGNAEKESVFSDLQRFRGARLIEPHGTPHMYYAAIESRSCGLTPLGKFYWRRVKGNKI